jgi:hypothetical protein
MGFPKGASIPFGQWRHNPAREVASFIDKAAGLLCDTQIGKSHCCYEYTD